MTRTTTSLSPFLSGVLVAASTLVSGGAGAAQDDLFREQLRQSDGWAVVAPFVADIPAGISGARPPVKFLEQLGATDGRFEARTASPASGVPATQPSKAVEDLLRQLAATDGTRS